MKSQVKNGSEMDGAYEKQKRKEFKEENSQSY